jgi:hypothetical protein
MSVMAKSNSESKSKAKILAADGAGGLVEVQDKRFERGDWPPKGDFFITLEPRDPPRLHMVLNWFEELKQRVPVH